MAGILQKLAPTFYCLRCHEALPKAETARFMGRSTEVRCDTCGLTMFGRDLLAGEGLGEPKLNRLTSAGPPPEEAQAEVRREEGPLRLTVILGPGAVGGPARGKIRTWAAGLMLSVVALAFAAAAVGAALQGKWLVAPVLLAPLGMFGLFMFGVARSVWGRDELTLDATGVTLERRLGRLRWLRRVPAESIELVRRARVGHQRHPSTWADRAVEVRGTRTRLRFGHQLREAEQVWLRDELAAFIINHVRSPLRDYVRGR